MRYLSLMLDENNIRHVLKHARTQEVFRAVVQHFMDTGDTIGSRDLSKILSNKNISGISPASIRNELADLEDMGLLVAKHTSAGREPTNQGLQLFIDQMITVETPDLKTMAEIDKLRNKNNITLDTLFEQASEMIAGLSSYAAIVAAPHVDSGVKSIDFERLQTSGKILAVISFADGTTDNRLVNIPSITATDLEQVSNYLRSISGMTLKETREALAQEISINRVFLDALTESLESRGLISNDKKSGLYFVHGQSGLMTDEIMKDDDQLAQLRRVIDEIERKQNIDEILRLTEDSQPVRVFVGAKNQLFRHAGLSVVTAGIRGRDQEVLGALAVVGPTRMNYSRVVQVVEHSANAVSDVIQRLDRKAGLH